MSVHHLDIGEAHGVVHLIAGLQPFQQGFLTVIVSPGHQQSDHVLGAEGVADPLLRHLGLVLPRSLDLGIAVHIGAPVGEEKAPHQGHNEQRHSHMAQLQDKSAPAVDPGDEAAVAGPLHRLGKEHQQPRHQGEHRQHTEQNGLDQHDAHVEADLKLHEHHGRQAGDGGEAAGGDGGNGGADRRNARLPVSGVLPLLQEAVQHDDGIVDGQSQLEHHRHRVGDKGDLSEDEVRAQIQQGRRDKGQQQHRNLRIGAGSQQQHQHDDNRRYRQDDPHLIGQGVRLGIPHRAVYIKVIGGQQLPDGLHGGQGGFVILLPRKGHGDQRVRALEIRCDVLRCLGLPVLLCADAVSQGRGGDALDLPDLFRQILRDAPRHVGHHHPGGTEGGEFLLHQGQPLAGLCGVRQVLRDVVADADPVPGEQAEQQRTRVQEKDQLPLIHDHRGQPHKKGWFFSVFAHSFSSFRQSRSHHGSGEIRLPSHRIRQTSAVITPVRRSPWSSSAVSQKRVLTAVRIA